MKKNSNPLVGLIFEYRGGQARIMATAEGYAMARKPRAGPFVVRLKEVEQQFAVALHAASEKNVRSAE